MTTPSDRYPNDPCLNRLANAIQTRTGHGIGGPDIVYHPPEDMTDECGVSCAGNTRVRIENLVGGESVEIVYNRQPLSILAHHYGPVKLGFTPVKGKDRAAIIKAISKHFRRSMSVRDFMPQSFSTLREAPNGKYTLELKAADDSYGWIGDYTVILTTEVDLVRTAVTALPPFDYVSPFAIDISEAEVTALPPFEYSMPINLADADVTALPPFPYTL